jgi:hypothetical protein
MPDGRFEGAKIGVGFGPEPLVFDFAPERLNFVQVRTVGRQMKNVHILVFPVLQAGAKSSAVVQAGIIEYEYGGGGAGSYPGVERGDDKSGVQPARSGGGVEVVGVGMVEPNTLNRCE